MIGGYPVTIKFAPRFDVMNVQSLAKFFLGDATPLASKTVSFAGGSGLCAPVVATPFFVSAQPCRVVWPRHIAGFTLPLKSTFLVTKDIFLYLARMAADYLAAIVAWLLHSFFVLRMGRSSDILASPGGLAFSRAKAVIRAFDTVRWAGDWFLTDGTGHNLTGSSGCVTTGQATVFLLCMIPGWHEQFIAVTAGLFLALSLVLIAAGDRAKFHRSVSSRFDWFLAVLTSDHISIIA